MLVTDLTAYYSNCVIITPVTHSMGDFMIYWLIYRDHLLPCIYRRPEQVELIELMREPFFVSHNLNCIKSWVNPFRVYHLAGKQFIRPKYPTTVQNRPIQNNSTNDRPTLTNSKQRHQWRARTDNFEPKPFWLWQARIGQTRPRATVTTKRDDPDLPDKYKRIYPKTPLEQEEYLHNAARTGRLIPHYQEKEIQTWPTED